MERPVARRVATDVSFRDLANGFESLGIGEVPVVVHASLSSFGNVLGGAEAVVSALVTRFAGVMVPAFTYKTMVVPEDGPLDNGVVYGSGRHTNRMAHFWSTAMPADRLMGAVPEALRQHRLAERSSHPILSFCGVGVGEMLGQQPLSEPCQPLSALAEAGGWVLLLGADHAVNTSLHVAERLAGRRTFVRWALTEEGVQACPNFPGCSNGFPELAESLAPLATEVQIGRCRVQAFPAREMIERARDLFMEKPGGYLCKRIDCGRCNAVRGG